MELFEYIDMPKKPYDIFYSESVNSPLHWHYYSEIIYMLGGEVNVVCNNKKTILREGDLCCVYPLQLHEFSRVGSKNARYAVIKFDIHTINIPKAYISRMYNYFVRRTREDDHCITVPAERLNGSLINERIRHIVDEYAQKREFYSLAVQADIFSLLIEIARSCGKKIAAERDSLPQTDLSFFHILEYIDTHSAEPLEVAELARMCHLSYSHFARLFRENYGRSCKEYITYIRLNKAQDLLFHTDYDLSYIAQETGFFDCSHFIRTYKKWKGITPKQERQRLL